MSLIGSFNHVNIGEETSLVGELDPTCAGLSIASRENDFHVNIREMEGGCLHAYTLLKILFHKITNSIP